VQHKSISLVKSLSGGLGPKREDRPAAFAGRSESVFWIFCWWDTARAYTGEYPIPTRALPSTPQAGHTGKESENAAGEKADTFGGKQFDPLHLINANSANDRFWQIGILARRLLLIAGG